MQLRVHLYLVVILLYFGIVPNVVAQDSSVPNDTLVVSPVLVSDSIHVKNDSVKSNAIDAPILFNAKDSIHIFLKGGNTIHMYGESNVSHKDMLLEAEYIEMDAGNSIISATYALDSIGDEFGYPVFRQGNMQYEMKKVDYNFKTGKSYLTDLVTEQGEGYMTAHVTKKMPDDILYMLGGRYTTCSDHDHPHFYLQMTKAKLQPGRVVFGPSYLVVEDVPFKFIMLPFGFFPSTNEYSSGIIMPTYGDELTRGFSLRDGGYYFAFSDNIDLALTGEIFTKGSWGVSARSTYNKRYKYSGSFNSSYIVTMQEDSSNPDVKNASKDFKITWSHQQDAKANPFMTFSSSVDFSTSSYNRNKLDAVYSYNDYSQNTKASRVGWSYRHPEKPFTLSANFSVDQQSRDSTLSMTLPNLTFSVREFYPFKRKIQVGNQKWYENIRMSYTATVANSISKVKEAEFLQKNIIKDWKNGVQHKIPISASFNMFKYVNVTPSINYTERWYSSRIDKSYDRSTNQWILPDTTYGFYRLYDYSGAVNASTKLYGMYKPWGLFGSWTKGVQIRHVLTPTVGFSGAPDFGDAKYGYYKYANIPVDEGMEQPYYSPFAGQVYGTPGQGRSGTMTFSLDNNLEMKIPAGEDSTRVISLIDNLRFGMNYNFLKDSLNWSDLSANVRLKFSKSFTLNLQGNFETYLFDENGNRINKTRFGAGKGIGRLKGTGTSFSYSINNETLKNLFEKKGSDSDVSSDPSANPDANIPIDDMGGQGAEMETSQRSSLMRGKKQTDEGYDSDGYLLLDIPWNLSFNYSLALSTNMNRTAFDKIKREYPYQTTQTLGVSGSITPTKNWNFNFNTSYDFDVKKFATMQCSLSRQMHCWTMTASIIPIGPYQSYTFSIAVNSSMLQDLKYNQSSSSRDALNWGN